MIDFQREEDDARAASGLSPGEILSRVASTSPALHERLRARYLALAARPAPTLAERMERDRLDSLMQVLYGPHGLLRQAGALMALADRLERAAALAPRCSASAEVAGRLRRETLILRAFGREQVGRTVGPSTATLSKTLSALARAVGRLHDFCLAAQAADDGVGSHRKARALRTAAFIADDFPQSKTVGDAVAFVLERLSESALVGSAKGHYDALCDTHAASLREELWEAAEGGFSRRATPATLRELTELDLTLELLCAKLSDRTLDSDDRREAIGELYALVAGSRAADALAQAKGALAPLVDTLRTGLEAEVTGA